MIFHSPLGRYMEKKIPDSSRVMFQNSGHYPHWEEAEKFNFEVARFLDRL